MPMAHSSTVASRPNATVATVAVITMDGRTTTSTSSPLRIVESAHLSDPGEEEEYDDDDIEDYEAQFANKHGEWTFSLINYHRHGLGGVFNMHSWKFLGL